MNVAIRSFFVVLLFVAVAGARPPASAAESEAKRPTPVDAKRIDALIRQLGADDYFAREKAQAELVEIGAEAFDALSEVGDRIHDVEVTERIAYLLRTIRVRWVEPNDPADVRNLMQNYEGMSDLQRRETIMALGSLPGLMPLGGLCRIVRFEPSQMLSKLAALSIMSQTIVPDDKWAERAAALQAGVAGGPRPAAQWLRTYLAEHDDPQAGVTAFAALVDEEEQLLRQFPHRTAPEIVMRLLRRQAETYKRLERPHDMIAALIRMVAYEQGETVLLNEVVQKLTEQKDWPALAEFVQRFDERIAQDAEASYQVARAYEVQGDKAAMNRYADQALQLNPGDQRRHIVMGIELRNRGWIDWAEKEYRASIKMGAATQAFTLIAQYQLGESLHDRGDDLAAAKVLDEATLGLEQAASQNLDVSDARRGLEANRARAHYFYALHYKQQPDEKKTLQHLLEGLGEDQYDAELLIELFHLPNLDVTLRDRVRKLIRESADIYRRQMSDHPDDDTPFNQFAWLISNTEGDFQEALDASKKSLEIKPDSPGHLDTLGRCYFAIGDYENAVKTQARAAEFDPHSQQMQRQLKVFQAALDKKKQAEK